MINTMRVAYKLGFSSALHPESQGAYSDASGWVFRSEVASRLFDAFCRGYMDGYRILSQVKYENKMAQRDARTVAIMGISKRLSVPHFILSDLSSPSCVVSAQGSIHAMTDTVNHLPVIATAMPQRSHPVVNILCDELPRFPIENIELPEISESKAVKRVIKKFSTNSGEYKKSKNER